MSKRIVVNQPVAITSVTFNKDLETYPTRMEYGGRQYDLIQAGLRCSVRHAGRIAHVITMSDGESRYQLKYDQSNALWTLLAITHG